ncbi:MAG TPA: MOSC N-terminal beta barrel domain-containing protein [Longimicrobiaceae bacterium]
MSTSLSVAALWRYPVKSMRGEEVAEAQAGPRGLAGDRAYAVVDAATGHVASAKHPRRWAALLASRAEYEAEPGVDGPAPPVRITLPDGRRVSGEDPGVHAVLSELLGRPVRLASPAPQGALREADRSPPEAAGSGAMVREEPLALAAPAGTFFDVAPLHLLPASTLRSLRELRPGSDFDPRRFRPNLVLAGDAPEAGSPEGDWPGRALLLGGVRLRVIDPSPRCVVTTLAQGGLPRDPDVLRTLAGATSAASLTLAPGVVFPAVAGVYATVEAGGTLRLGMPARLL